MVYNKSFDPKKPTTRGLGLKGRVNSLEERVFVYTFPEGEIISGKGLKNEFIGKKRWLFDPEGKCRMIEIYPSGSNNPSGAYFDYNFESGLLEKVRFVEGVHDDSLVSFLMKFHKFSHDSQKIKAIYFAPEDYEENFDDKISLENDGKNFGSGPYFYEILEYTYAPINGESQLIEINSSFLPKRRHKKILFNYSPEGKMVETRSLFGDLTLYEYDFKGNITKTTFFDKIGSKSGTSIIHTYEFDQMGNWIKVWDSVDGNKEKKLCWKERTFKYFPDS